MLAAALSAEPLRLDDLFSTGTVTASPVPPPPTASPSPTPQPAGDRTDALGILPTPVPPRQGGLTMRDIDSRNPGAVIEGARLDLAAGDFQRVIEITDLLAAFLAKRSPEYGDTLLLRARAFEALNEQDKLLEVSRLYMSDFPTGPHRQWFLIRLADEARRVGRVRDAAVIWREVIRQPDTRIEPAEALRAAEDLVASAMGAQARLALGRVSEDRTPWLAHQRQRRDFLLLESLLVEDDPAVSPPSPASAEPERQPALRLRLGLLHELRGDDDRAREEYSALAGELSQYLSPAEKSLLELRQKRMRFSPWPPPTPVPTTPQPTATPAPAGRQPALR